MHAVLDRRDLRARPARRDESFAFAEAQEPASSEDGSEEAARRTLADCDARLARYRAALEAGMTRRRRSVVQRGPGRRQDRRGGVRRRRPAAALTEADIGRCLTAASLFVGLQCDQALDDPRSRSITGLNPEFGSQHVQRRSSSDVSALGS